jgi:DNA-binding CsgD family transcriptional regulator
MAAVKGERAAMARDAVLPAVIGAIGEPGFAAILATTLRRSIRFELAAMLLHGPSGPELLFDDFDVAGGRLGLANYVRHTHRINPMLKSGGNGALRRARDFRLPGIEQAGSVRDHVIACADEEMGFRTVGWPARLEEVGLYIETAAGLVELGFYRERGSASLSRAGARALSGLAVPIGAAFERHRALVRRTALEEKRSLLTNRQDEVADLLLTGCSSRAIAARLGLSLHTVKDHRKQLFDRLGISSLAELFALSRRRD